MKRKAFWNFSGIFTLINQYKYKSISFNHVPWISPWLSGYGEIERDIMKIILVQFHLYTYIYIYRERERERESENCQGQEEYDESLKISFVQLVNLDWHKWLVRWDKVKERDAQVEDRKWQTDKNANEICIYQNLFFVVIFIFSVEL